MTRVSYILLIASGILIFLGGLADVLTTIIFNSVPATHVQYVHTAQENISTAWTGLDHALLRALGGILMALGIMVVTISVVVRKTKIKTALIPVVFAVLLGEGINASQMLLIHSSYFIFPVFCAVCCSIGGLLAMTGRSDVRD